MSIKKIIVSLLTGCLLLTLLAGCGTKGEAGQTTAATTRVITDQAGNQVTIPTEINRVVITSVTPLPALFCLFMGSADKLVGMYPASKRTAQYSIVSQLVPGIMDVDTGFYDGTAINVEELIKLKPDVVFYFAGKDDEKKAIESAGLPAVAFDPFYDGNNGGDGNNIVEVAHQWINFLGEIFQMPDKADKFHAQQQKIEQLVAGRLSGITDDKRPNTLIVSNYNDSALMVGGTQTADYWIRYAGGTNAAIETGKPMAKVNMEQIYQWNPDVIILNSFSAYTADDIINSTAAQGQDWSGLQAVKDRRVYKMPLGTYYWYATCYEGPLMLLWMATKLQPAAFADIDMTQYTRDYFKDVLDVTLTDQQLDLIFNPLPDAHM